MFFRVGIATLVTQEFGERAWVGPWGANGLARGTTWGALLPQYDGMEPLGRAPRDDADTLYASSVDRLRNRMATETMPSRGALRSTMAPLTWQEPTYYETEVPAVAPSDAGGILRALNPSVVGHSALNPGS